MNTLYRLLDTEYDPARLRSLLDEGLDLNAPDPESGEPPIFTAARRRRLDAVDILLERGADPDRPGRHGKTAWAHAIRRGFFEVSDRLEQAGASTVLSPADRLAVALSRKDLPLARQILEEDPACARTGNPEEDRTLADMAGRPELEPVRLLVEAGADLRAPGLDGGTPLHQSAWFGQPTNARFLVEAGAPLDVFDPVHDSSPLHWAVHGSRYSGDAEERQASYVELTRLLLEAGSRLSYPPEITGVTRTYEERLLADATPAVARVLREAGLGEGETGGVSG